MNHTIKLFYNDAYADCFSAKVLKCDDMGGKYGIVLDATMFYPEGGGQPYDTGRIGGVNVTETRERGGVIVHTTDGPLDPFKNYECTVDLRRRFAFMQNHTGEHIISGIIDKMFGLSNVGFHMGSEFTTIDTDGELSAEDLTRLEMAANRAVFENVPVTADYPDAETLAEMKYRSKKELSGEVRIVTVPGYDACACCGLHCRNTGEVGVIKIVDAQKYKGGMRIYMLFGESAVLDYAAKNRDIYALSKLLSAKPGSVFSAVEALAAENTVLKQQVNGYKAKFIEKMAGDILPGTSCVCLFIDDFVPDDLRRLAVLAGERAGIAAVFSGNDKDGYKYAVSGKNIDARQFAGLMNTELGGRGGGQPALAQGTVYAGREAVRLFIDERSKDLAC